MADNLTDSEENRLLDLSLPTDSSVYVALYTTAPTDSTSGTEVSGGSYARQAVAFPSASSGSKSNSSEILFTTATASWGTIVAIGIVSASTGGTIRWYRALSGGEQRTVASGDQFRIPASGMTFTMS